MIVTYFSIGKYFELQEGNRLKENLQNSAESINHFMLERIESFKVLTNNPFFSTNSNEAISKYLLKTVNESAFYDNLFFVNKNGIIVSSSDPKFVGINMLQLDPNFENVFNEGKSKGSKVVQVLPIHAASQKKITNYSPLDVELLSNVVDLNENRVGALVGFVSFHNLAELTFDIDEKIFENTHTYLLNSKGEVLMLDSQKNVTFNSISEFLMNPFPENLQRGKNNFYISENSKGTKIILGYAPLLKRGVDGTGNWSLVSIVPYEEVMLPVNQMIFKIFLVFSIITSILIALIFVVSRTITAPLIELEKAITDFEINKKPINIKSGKKDEIGSLYRSFNTMAENLYSSYIIENSLAKEKEVIKDNLAHFIQSANAPIFGIDSNGLIREWNIATENITGYKKSEVLGQNIILDFVPKEYRKSVKRVLYDTLKGKETTTFELPLLTKDNQRVMILLNSSTFRDTNGKITGVIGVGQNITERIKKDEQFRLVIESIPNALILVNPAGEITLINKQAEIEFGYTPEELIGEKMELLIPSRYKKEHPGHVSEYMAAPESRAMGKRTEIYALRKNGLEFPVEIGLNPIKTSDGTLIMASIVNITERNEHNANLKEKEERAKELFLAKEKIAIQKEALIREKELNELKSRFVSITSHEFRTPLSAINFAAGSIKKYWAKMEPIMIEKKLSKIEAQVLHMTNILDDVLIVGQAGAGKIKNIPLNINLENFISEIINEVYISFKKSHEILLIDNEELKSGVLFIDKKMGRNIFINLISNAIKFSPEATKVTVELSSEKDYIIISITDFGIGISESELKNIFNPFFRGENVDLIQGTGLGLTIVKEAIDLMGGKLIVTSNIGEGSSFIVKIPKK